MTMRTFQVAFCLLLLGCQLDTSGMPDLPAAWRAWYRCGSEGSDQPMTPGAEVRQGDWRCTVEADGEELRLACDKVGTSVEAFAYCHEGSGRMLLYLGQCRFQTACGD